MAQPAYVRQDYAMRAHLARMHRITEASSQRIGSEPQLLGRSGEVKDASAVGERSQNNVGNQAEAELKRLKTMIAASQAQRARLGELETSSDPAASAAAIRSAPTVLARSIAAVQRHGTFGTETVGPQTTTGAGSTSATEVAQISAEAAQLANLYEIQRVLDHRSSGVLRTPVLSSRAPALAAQRRIGSGGALGIGVGGDSAQVHDKEGVRGKQMPHDSVAAGSYRVPSPLPSPPPPSPPALPSTASPTHILTMSESEFRAAIAAAVSSAVAEALDEARAQNTENVDVLNQQLLVEAGMRREAANEAACTSASRARQVVEEQGRLASLQAALARTEAELNGLRGLERSDCLASPDDGSSACLHCSHETGLAGQLAEAERSLEAACRGRDELCVKLVSAQQEALDLRGMVDDMRRDMAQVHAGVGEGERERLEQGGWLPPDKADSLRASLQASMTEQASSRALSARALSETLAAAQAEYASRLAAEVAEAAACARENARAEAEKERVESVKAALHAAGGDFKGQLTQAVATLHDSLVKEKEREVAVAVGSAREQYEALMREWECTNEVWRRDTLSACESSLAAARAQVEDARMETAAASLALRTREAELARLRGGGAVSPPQWRAAVQVGVGAEGHAAVPPPPPPPPHIPNRAEQGPQSEDAQAHSQLVPPHPPLARPPGVPARLYETILCLSDSALRAMLSRSSVPFDDAMAQEELQGRLLAAVEKGQGQGAVEAQRHSSDAFRGGDTPPSGASTGAPGVDSPTPPREGGDGAPYEEEASRRSSLHTAGTREERERDGEDGDFDGTTRTSSVSIGNEEREGAGDSVREADTEVEGAQDEAWLPVTSEDGKTYYYHSLTRETRWDAPVSSHAHVHIAARVEARMRHQDAHLKARQEQRQAELAAAAHSAAAAHVGRSRVEGEIDARVGSWSRGGTRGIRHLLATLSTVLLTRPDCVPEEVSLAAASGGPDELKRAYLRALKLVHPDKLAGIGAGVDVQLEAARVFTVLSDAHKRYTSGADRDVPYTGNSSASHSAGGSWHAHAKAGGGGSNTSAGGYHSARAQQHLNAASVMAAAAARARAAVERMHAQHRAQAGVAAAGYARAFNRDSSAQRSASVGGSEARGSGSPASGGTYAAHASRR